MGSRGQGFRVQISGFRVQGSECRNKGIGVGTDHTRREGGE